MKILTPNDYCRYSRRIINLYAKSIIIEINDQINLICPEEIYRTSALTLSDVYDVRELTYHKYEDNINKPIWDN